VHLSPFPSPSLLPSLLSAPALSRVELCRSRQPRACYMFHPLTDGRWTAPRTVYGSSRERGRTWWTHTGGGKAPAFKTASGGFQQCRRWTANHASLEQKRASIHASIRTRHAAPQRPSRAHLHASGPRAATSGASVDGAGCAEPECVYIVTTTTACAAEQGSEEGFLGTGLCQCRFRLCWAILENRQIFSG
jgi:hypothetical protein